MAISINQKPTIYRNLFENTGPELDSDELPCTVCGSDRVQVRQQRIRTKYRISEVDGARNFLETAKCLNDFVSVKVADIDTVAEVFAADIFYHSHCMRKYLHAYDRAKIQDEQRDSSATTSRKRNLFQRSLEHLDVLITDGYALSVTEIKDLMMNMDDTDNIHIYNNKVKIFFNEHYYADKITFSKSNGVNQSELVYSSDIDADTLATKLRNLDVVRSAVEIMGQALRNVDFKLQDKFL